MFSHFHDVALRATELVCEFIRDRFRKVLVRKRAARARQNEERAEREGGIGNVTASVIGNSSGGGRRKGGK
jgi:hypothetical protein